jgi:shikimate kinase
VSVRRTTGADGRPIFLIGFMGSGKTAVGRRVADRLGWEFLDTDELVVAREGRSIERIFNEAGEAAFRRAEWAVLRSLDGRQRCVVATGGGLFLDPRARSWLRVRGVTVWLDLPLEACRTRVGTGAGRPLWDPAGDPVAFRALFEKRRAAYALAAVRIAAEASPAEVADRLLEGLDPISP